jgi:hypothetical protein
MRAEDKLNGAATHPTQHAGGHRKRERNQKKAKERNVCYLAKHTARKNPRHRTMAANETVGASRECAQPTSRARVAQPPHARKWRHVVACRESARHGDALPPSWPTLSLLDGGRCCAPAPGTVPHTARTQRGTAHDMLPPVHPQVLWCDGARGAHRRHAKRAQPLSPLTHLLRGTAPPRWPASAPSPSRRCAVPQLDPRAHPAARSSATPHERRTARKLHHVTTCVFPENTRCPATHARAAAPYRLPALALLYHLLCFLEHRIRLTASAVVNARRSHPKHNDTCGR